MLAERPSHMLVHVREGTALNRCTYFQDQICHFTQSQLCCDRTSQSFTRFVCLASQQRASVSRGRICIDNFTCCHNEIEVADQTFYLIQSQYTDTGLTSPSADPTPGAWKGRHWSASF